MFEYERVYAENIITSNEVKWFFEAREGDCGPYETKAQALAMLDAFIQECIQLGKTGGRDVNIKPCQDVVVNKRHKFFYPAEGDLHLDMAK
jgi:transposase